MEVDAVTHYSSCSHMMTAFQDCGSLQMDPFSHTALQLCVSLCVCMSQWICGAALFLPFYVLQY